MKLLKKATLVLISASFLVGLSACNSSDVALGVGLAVGVAAGLTIDSSPRICHGGYRDECTTYRDRWGVLQTQCRQVWDSCRTFDSDAGIVSRAPTATNSMDVVQVAQSFNISFEASTSLLSSLDAAKKGNLKSAFALGLDQEDFINLSKGQNIKGDSIEKLSQNLNIDLQTASDMMSSIAAAVPKK